MRAAGLAAALLLAAGALHDARPTAEMTRRRRPTYYQAKPDTSDPLLAERSAWNKVVDERKAAKRAAKLAKKGGA